MESALGDAQQAYGAATREAQTLQSSLSDAQEQGAEMRAELASLRSLVRAAKASQEQDDTIDKRLAASVLVKYFERGSSDVLAVLASMLGCTRDEQQALGLLPRGNVEPPAEGKLSDKWIVRAAPRKRARWIASSTLVGRGAL